MNCGLPWLIRWYLSQYTWTKPSIDWSTHAQRTVYITRDSVAPTVASATVNGTELTITFNEDLDADATLANSAFTVKKTASGTETSPRQPHRRLHLRQDRHPHPRRLGRHRHRHRRQGLLHQAHHRLRQQARRQVRQRGRHLHRPGPSPTSSPTTTRPASPPPPRRTLADRGKQLTITYDEDLDTNSTPDKTAFEVMATPAGGSATSFTPTGVEIAGAAVNLTFDKPFAHNDALTVTYTKPATNPIQDLAGNDAPAFTDAPPSPTTAPSPASPSPPSAPRPPPSSTTRSSG